MKKEIIIPVKFQQLFALRALRIAIFKHFYSSE